MRGKQNIRIDGIFAFCKSWNPCLLLVTLGLLMAGASCSLKKTAVNTMADVFGEGEQVYLSDEDPELVAAALPFNMKTVETLLASSPEHRGLLTSAAALFSLYANGFVEPEADQIEDDDYDRAEGIRRRAARLYLRGYTYGLRGLEVAHPGFRTLLPREPEQAARELGLDDVPLAVWTAAALGAAISASKDDPEATADIGVVGALLQRALELDEDYDEGAIHGFLLSYEAGRVGGSPDKMRRHYDRAIELSGGNRLSVYLSWAEGVSVREQNRQEFLELLHKVLSYDVDSHPPNRLLNILAQRRARWLQDRIDKLFLEGEIP
jgi:predicted anti-sigma-YlaC factor YlaD